MMDRYLELSALHKRDAALNACRRMKTAQDTGAAPMGGPIKRGAASREKRRPIF